MREGHASGTAELNALLRAVESSLPERAEAGRCARIRFTALALLLLCAGIGCAVQWQLAMRSGAQSLYLGNDSGAYEHFRRALQIAEASGGDDPRIAPSLEALSAVQYQRGRPDQAEPLLRRALALREELDGAQHPELVYALLGLYHVTILDPGRHEEAETHLTRLESIANGDLEYEPEWREQRLLMALVISEAARVRLRAGDLAAADLLYRNALDRFERRGRSTLGFELAAIEEYQELLEGTGRESQVPLLHARFDHTTRGAEDYLNHATRYRRNDRRVARWPRSRMPLRVHLSRPSESEASDPDAVMDVARDAVLAWADVVDPGLPSFRFVDERSDSDVAIVWMAEQTDHAVGRAMVRPTRGGGLEVDWIRVVLRYEDGSEAPLDFLRLTLMHEMGHALGLIGHSPYPSDIMCERARGCLVGRIQGLTDRDRRTLQRLYGGR